MANIGPIKLGNVDFVLQESRYVFDPRWGISRTQYGEGSEELCLQAAAQVVQNFGYRCEVNPVAGTGQYRLVVYYPDLNDGVTDAPVTRWSIKTEVEDVDIFTLPEAADEMSFYDPPSLYRKLLVDAAKNGEEYPFTNAELLAFPFTATLYKWLCEGIRSVPEPRTTLFRNRSMPWDHAEGVIVEEYRTVYTTAALIDEFEIPNYIARKLPTGGNMLAPPGRVWGWLRMNADCDSQEGATFKQDEVISWIFAPWDQELYNIVS